MSNKIRHWRLEGPMKSNNTPSCMELLHALLQTIFSSVGGEGGSVTRHGQCLYQQLCGAASGTAGSVKAPLSVRGQGARIISYMCAAALASLHPSSFPERHT